MADLERQNVSPTQFLQQYGTIEPGAHKTPKEGHEKLPLFLGRWDVAPEKLYRICFTTYVVWFVVHRIADVAYLLTVDARFPEGLSHLYPSEAERLESVAYTREVLLCGLAHRTLVFGVVCVLAYFQLFARFDTSLHEFYAATAAWWESSRIKYCLTRSWECCCSPIWRCLAACFSPIQRCMGCMCGRPYSWCMSVKENALNGRLVTDLNDRFGFRLSFRELLHGSFYLSLFGAFFFLISAPFMYWMQTIDLRFGFANSLNVSLANFKMGVFSGVISMVIWGIPKKFVFLAVLQYRLGWLFMWAGLTISICFAQYNVQILAPMLGMNNQFPTELFAVGRGFPLASTGNKHVPWISLNRVFYKDPSVMNAQSEQFSTRDMNKGPLSLFHNSKNGSWVIADNILVNPAAAIYAQTKNPATEQTLESLAAQSWTVGDPETRVGLRSGKALRDKLFGFARESRIGIGQIYMVDGSHKDVRGNAFVTGAGNHSIIGLYDTLFLGQRGSDKEETTEDDDVHELTSGGSLLQHASEVVQSVDVDDEDRRTPRNSAPTKAMTDDEIVAILAHELAHSALKHMEQGMGAQAFTSFVTFAVFGWMAHSPLAAAALALSSPLVHVGACAYDHLVGPPVEGMMKLLTNWLTLHNEYEADAYAAEISERYGSALQTSLAKLSVNSNQDPDVPFFYEVLHSDHPTFARRWQHIEEVKQKKYGKDAKKQLTDTKEGK